MGARGPTGEVAAESPVDDDREAAAAPWAHDADGDEALLPALLPAAAAAAGNDWSAVVKLARGGWGPREATRESHVRQAVRVCDTTCVPLRIRGVPER